MKNLNLRLNDELHAKLKGAADRDHRSLNQEIIYLLEEIIYLLERGLDRNPAMPRHPEQEA